MIQQMKENPVVPIILLMGLGVGGYYLYMKRGTQTTTPGSTGVPVSYSPPPTTTPTTPTSKPTSTPSGTGSVTKPSTYTPPPVSTPPATGGQNPNFSSASAYVNGHPLIAYWYNGNIYLLYTALSLVGFSYSTNYANHSFTLSDGTVVPGMVYGTTTYIQWNKIPGLTYTYSGGAYYFKGPQILTPSGNPYLGPSSSSGYPSTTAYVNGQKYAAIAVNGNTYLLYTALNQLGVLYSINYANHVITVPGWGNIQGVVQNGTTWVPYNQIPGIQYKFQNGAWYFTAIPVTTASGNPIVSPPATTGHSKTTLPIYGF